MPASERIPGFAWGRITTVLRSPALALITMLGCVGEMDPQPFAGAPAAVPSPSGGNLLQDCDPPLVLPADNIARFWVCGQKLRFVRTTGTPAMEAALLAAGAEWNGAILAPGGTSLNLPRFRVSGEPTAPSDWVLDVINTGGAGSMWCGTVTGQGGVEVSETNPPREVRIAMGECGALADVARHELAHVLGLNEAWHKPMPTAVMGHCAVAITSTSAILGRTLCPHLRDLLYLSYGVVSGTFDPSRHIVTSLSSVSSLNLLAGQVVSAAPSGIEVLDANYSLCFPASTIVDWWRSCGGYQPPPGYSFQYVSSNPAVATVHPSTGLVTGIQAGVTNITISVQSLPANLQATPTLTGNLVSVRVFQPSQVVITAGEGVTSPAGTAVMPPPTVRVLEADGLTGVPGVAVTFGSASGGSTLSGTNVITNASGYASVGAWVLGPTAGAYTMSAVVNASISPNTRIFHATATAPSTIFCPEPSCAPVTAAYISHFTNADCTGIESYYTPYFGSDGVRRSWDGAGRTGNLVGTVSNKSWKQNDGGGDGTGCRRNAWPGGNSLPGFVTVYRAVCGEASCVGLGGAYISHFTNANCTGVESYYTPYFAGDGIRRSWDGAGIAGTSVHSVTNKSWKRNDGGGDGSGCRVNAWPSGNPLPGFVTIYR